MVALHRCEPLHSLKVVGAAMKQTRSSFCYHKFLVGGRGEGKVNNKKLILLNIRLCMNKIKTDHFPSDIRLCL